jgi:hypothetical protein
MRLILTVKNIPPRFCHEFLPKSAHLRNTYTGDSLKDKCHQYLYSIGATFYGHCALLGTLPSCHLFLLLTIIKCTLSNFYLENFYLKGIMFSYAFRWSITSQNS